MPAVSMLGMNLRMTAFAQSDEIASIMCSTLREWELMMYLFGCDVTSVLQALLTQWVGSSVAVTDAFPISAVASLGSRVTVVLFVAFVLFLLVLQAVATVRKVRAAGMGTRSFRFPWHWCSPPSGIRKALQVW